VNCVAAGLVERPEHMPGSVFDFACWRRGYIDVARPAIYFADNADARPAVIRMEVTPPPLLYEAFDGDVERLIYAMNRLRDDAVRRVRLTRSRPALGTRAVQRIHPWSEPRSLRERGGRLVPTFSVGQRGRAGREKTVRASLEVRGFRRSHHEARVAHRDGERSRRFPFGTYAMRTMHGAAVEPSAHPQAIVAQPGPLLCDVQARLREKRQSSEDARKRSITLMENVRAELEQEAEAADEMDFSQTRETTEHSAERDKADVVTRHRLDGGTQDHAAQQSGPEAARRIIVLRDRRIGRPRQRMRHGADPPV
jgi:hypothetical protein